MSQSSEERVSDEVVPLPTARVVPFERPQSELQKAVQERAQEIIDRERERAVRSRPAPWRRALVLAFAAIPVFLTFGAAIGFIGALRQFNTAVFDSAQRSESQAPQPSASAPVLTSDDPEVVLIQPFTTQPAEDNGKSTVTPQGH